MSGFKKAPADHVRVKHGQYYFRQRVRKGLEPLFGTGSGWVEHRLGQRVTENKAIRVEVTKTAQASASYYAAQWDALERIPPADRALVVKAEKADGPGAFVAAVAADAARVAGYAQAATIFPGDLEDLDEEETLEYVRDARRWQKDPTHHSEVARLQREVIRLQTIVTTMTPQPAAQPVTTPSAPGTDDPTTWTVARLLDRWGAAEQQKPQTFRHWRTIITKFLDHLGTDPLASTITTQQCAGFILSLADGSMSKNTALHYMKGMRAFFGFGVDAGACIDRVASKAKFPKGANWKVVPRRRALRLSELQQTVAKAREVFGPSDPLTLALRLAIYTGARRCEVIGLLRRDLAEVEGAGLCIRITETDERGVKTEGAERVVPVHAALVDDLTQDPMHMDA